MCGRFALIQYMRIANILRGITLPPETLKARYNISPCQEILAILNTPQPQGRMVHWGLIPYWAKDRSMAGKMFNARAETLAEKPAFRDALRKRRCLIFADGFYEWRRHLDGKTLEPMYIRLKSQDLMAFAGLWEQWVDPQTQEQVASCTIVTTEPNSLLASIHDRMPVIISPNAYTDWLSPREIAPESVAGLLVDYPAELMEAYRVSPAVNAVGGNSPDMIQQVSHMSHLFEGHS